MADQDVNKLNCDQLKRYLQERGVSTTSYKKKELQELARNAQNIGLKRSEEKNDFDSSILVRRTVPVCHDSKTIVVPHINFIPSSSWKTDLRPMLAIGLNNIFVYMLESCRWSTKKLEIYKESSGFQLFQSGHIDQVKLHKFDSSEFDSCSSANTETFQYVKGMCTRETSQKEKPYTVAVLTGDSGKIHSAFCECPS